MSDEGKGGFLVTQDGQQHLPTRINGKLDHGLLGAAHAALFKSFRGKSYEGPDKEEAKKKLRALYEEAGLAWPAESASDETHFTIRLAEIPSQGGVRIPLAITGKWMRGDRPFEIAETDLSDVIENFSNKKNGEINVDYDHACEMPEVAAGGPIPSAGRIVRIDPPEAFNGSGQKILWGWFEPTDRARQLIAAKEYRYISPAIGWGVHDKVSGKRQGTTLTSVALTNRPFLEEMPQIHLSDPAFRLVDVDSVHVDGTGAGVSRQENSNSATADKERSMKTFKVKKLADGEHMGKRGVFDETGAMVALAEVEPDADDVKQVKAAEEQFAQFLTDQGFTGSTAEEVKATLQAGVRAQDAEKRAQSRNLLLSECIAGPNVDEVKSSGYLAAGKINVDDYRAAREGERRVRKLIDAAKLPARMGGEALKLFLSDAGAFKTLIEERPAPLNLKPTGASDGASGNTAGDFLRMVEMRQKEKNITYKLALSEVSNEHPDMASAYRNSVNSDTRAS